MHDPANLIPGVGELFMLPALTRTGPMCESLFIEAIPGGPLDVFDAKLDAEAQLERIKGLIQTIRAVGIRPRAQRRPDGSPMRGLIGRFAPDRAQGRSAHCPPARSVLELADAVVLNDPVLGQGSNNAIKVAAI